LTILDLGSGEGGTSYTLSRNNFVVSLDYSFTRLKRHSQNFDKIDHYRINSNAKLLPFASISFDLIILQDVIEHINETELLIIELNRILKPGGIIYLSTPNRFSVFNIISDPHWGMPFLSLFKRKAIKNFYLKKFRKDEIERKDIAELFSLNDLIKIFSNYFDVKLYTKFAVEELFKGNKGIVWSDFHLSLVKLTAMFKLDKLILRIVNNKLGIVNKFFTPAFFLIFKKR
ncbi:MAG: class I SAM-dependent methyltransferase, partial [Ignavibacteriaceae bacterium]|nr:class I SAM-dependent methyltransferase [Ignavibacteriaceae bacterium]